MCQADGQVQIDWLGKLGFGFCVTRLILRRFEVESIDNPIDV
jgi:hypothetical protein